ncbi:MAG TPA: histidine phosphatase family protein [Acidimicrobiia bacterium]|nr:histidine phosphatase family protein [Acidimicrobiia bacterium]
MTKLLVIRHGHAEGNSEHRFIGQSDVPLDDLGRLQARALANRLETTPIDRIVSSDLGRAIDTITPLAEAIGVSIERDPRLREIANGEWSGLLPEEISARWPDLWAAYRTGEDILRPGGEQWSTVRERVVTAAREHSSSGGVIVLCTHGGAGLNLAMWAAGFPAGGNIFMGKLGTLGNTSITTIEINANSGDQARLVGFNDVGHLAGATLDVRRPFDPVD